MMDGGGMLEWTGKPVWLFNEVLLLEILFLVFLGLSSLAWSSMLRRMREGGLQKGSGWQFK